MLCVNCRALDHHHAADVQRPLPRTRTIARSGTFPRRWPSRRRTRSKPRVALRTPRRSRTAKRTLRPLCLCFVPSGPGPGGRLRIWAAASDGRCSLPCRCLTLRKPWGTRRCPACILCRRYGLLCRHVLTLQCARAPHATMCANPTASIVSIP